MQIAVKLFKSLWLFLLVLLVMVANGLPPLVVGGLALIILLVPLWREYTTLSDLDERQRYISHLSSHIAFYVFLGLVVFIIVYRYLAKGQEVPPELNLLLIVPLVIKFLVSLFHSYGPLRTAQSIGYFFGGIWVLFALLSHGISLGSIMESLPFLLFIVIGQMAKRWPLVCGAAFVLLAVALIVLFGAWRQMDLFVQLLMWLLIPLPLFTAGIALFYYARGKA